MFFPKLLYKPLLIISNEKREITFLLTKCEFHRAKNVNK